MADQGRNLRKVNYENLYKNQEFLKQPKEEVESKFNSAEDKDQDQDLNNWLHRS